MSADNRICLMEWDYGTAWCGWKGSCSMNYHEPPLNAKWFGTEDEAIEWARDNAKDMVILEGGIQYISIEEQTLSLQECANDCLKRLDSIKKWGTQFPVNNDLNVS